MKNRNHKAKSGFIGRRRRRNPNDWTYDNVPSAFLFDRGFTGHEHMDVFGLINMNGRVYDPVLGVFLSPDNYVQAPDFSQNFNRFGYAFNNPLVYTDPDGEWAWLVPALIQAVQNYNSAIENGLGKGQALAYAATNFAGNAAASLINIPGIIPNAGAHAGMNIITNGISNSIVGRDFFENWGISAGSGAASGGFTGYQMAKAGGLNYWWGTEQTNWGYNRNQWALAWWDKPDVARSPIRSVAGEFPSGCVPTGMESIADSYGLTSQNQYFWKAEYQKYTGQPFSGVDPSKLEGFVESVNGYTVDKIPQSDVFGNIINGKRVGIGVANYGQSGAKHFMVVKKMFSWPNGNFRLVLMNPDGGGSFIINQSNIFNYAARFWSIYR